VILPPGRRSTIGNGLHFGDRTQRIHPQRARKSPMMNTAESWWDREFLASESPCGANCAGLMLRRNVESEITEASIYAGQMS